MGGNGYGPALGENQHAACVHACVHIAEQTGVMRAGRPGPGGCSIHASPGAAKALAEALQVPLVVS
jgi:hypothetical protein